MKINTFSVLSFVVKLLILSFTIFKVDINASDTLTGDTPLCAAAGAGQKVSCDVLIRRRADITVSNLKDVPPLHMATRQGHWSIADALLKEGSSPEILDSAKRTPLMIASLEGTRSQFFISDCLSYE